MRSSGLGLNVWSSSGQYGSWSCSAACWVCARMRWSICAGRISCWIIKMSALENRSRSVIFAAMRDGDPSRGRLGTSPYHRRSETSFSNTARSRGMTWSPIARLPSVEGPRVYGTDPDRLWDRIREKARAAGAKRIRFHDMRHSYASILLNQGFGAEKVARWLGTATPAWSSRSTVTCWPMTIRSRRCSSLVAAHPQKRSFCDSP